MTMEQQDWDILDCSISIEEVRLWIMERYGPITIQGSMGLFVAAVPVMGCIAIGFGFSIANAIWDLRRDLGPNIPLTPAEIILHPIEKERRKILNEAVKKR